MKHWYGWMGMAVVAASLAAPSVATAQSTQPATEAKTDAKSEELHFPQGVLFPYDLLDIAFRNNVDEHGNVNYLELKGNEALNLFVLATNTADMKAFPVWKMKDEQGNERLDRSAELTFWINAYNAHILKSIADAYPVKSVSEIEGLFTAKTHVIGGETYSLDEMRDLIVKRDPRALFALTDGTKGGPMLSPSAYRLTGLSQALDAAVATFVNDMRNVTLTRIQNEVLLNDFFKAANPLFQSKLRRDKWSGIRYLLSTYTKEGASRKYFTTNDCRIEFKAKDDSLNVKPL